MNKPIKPNITIPQSFAENGIKTDFDSDLLADGFDNLRPDVLAGDNLNKFIDDTYKGLNYGMAAADAINLINEGETLIVRDGKFTSGAVGGDFNDKLTNCLLEVPQRIKLELNDGVLTLKAGSKVIVPNGVGVFEEVVIDTDRTLTLNWGSPNDKMLLFLEVATGKLSRLNLPRIVSGATNPYTGSSSHIWYNTTANKVNWINLDGSLGIQVSLPIAEFTALGKENDVETPKVASIDQVFNGMGYIGSTIWVDKGVKGLIPNGRNEDGTLNNIEFTTSQVLRTTAQETTHHIRLNANKLQVGYLIYNEAKNINTKDGEYRDFAIVGTVTGDSNKQITSFQPKLPVRLVDWNDAKDYLKADRYDGQWVEKYNKLLVDGSATGALSVAEGAYSATFDLSSYLPNDGHDYLVSVRIYSQNASISTAYNNFLVDGGYGRMALGKVSGKSVFQDASIIVPIDKNHKLYVENAPSTGTSILVNIMLLNYRRIGTNN